MHEGAAGRVRPVADSRALTGHECSSVQRCGWAGRRNGDLLGEAEKDFDIFLTADQNLAYQQILRGRRVGVVVLSTNDLRRLRAAARAIADAVSSTRPGDVRFTAPEATMVQFRLMQGPEIAWPFPEPRAGDTTVQPDDDGGGSPSFVGGADGITLSGLAAGRYTIEVLTPTLTAPATAVDLVEGETREIEIAVSKR